MPGIAQRIITSLALLLFIGCASSAHHPANSPPIIQGPLIQTSRQLNVAIQGLGFFPVTLPNGQIGYTRIGKLYVDDDGRLVVRSGKDYPLCPPIRIPPGATNLTFYMSGEISYTKPGETTSRDPGQLKLAVFVNPAGLQPVNADPVYIATESSGPAVVKNPGDAGAGQIMQTYLEGVYHGL